MTVKHLAGQHDQRTHGRRSGGAVTRRLLARRLSRLGVPDGVTPSEAQRIQARRDLARDRGDVLAELEELVSINGQDDPAKLLGAFGRVVSQRDLNDDPVIAGLTGSLSGSRAEILDAIDAAAASLGLTRIGGNPADGDSQLVAFSREEHENIDDEPLRPGQWAIVARPGYRGEGIVVVRALVGAATPDEIAAIRPGGKSVKHLPGEHDQDDHGNRGPGMPKPGGKWKITAGEAIADVNAGVPVDGHMASSIAEAYTVEHGGLASHNITAMTRKQLDGTVNILVKGEVKDSSGKTVGDFNRLISPGEDGQLTVSHGRFELDKHVRGQGFAAALNGQAFDWYRHSGVKHVHLVANIDVGGYAWARAGYDWSDPDDIKKIRDRAMRMARTGAAKVPADRREEQMRLAREMADRLKTAKFGDDDFPTPFEVSQLGRWEGAGKDDWWAGKVIMMGSTWSAVTTP